MQISLARDSSPLALGYWRGVNKQTARGRVNVRGSAANSVTRQVQSIARASCVLNAFTWLVDDGVPRSAHGACSFPIHYLLVDRM